MSNRTVATTVGWLIAGVVAVFILGYIFGYQAGTIDTWAEVGLYEDGSYSSGCRTGGLCER